MKTIAASLLATTVASLALAIPTPASAEEHDSNRVQQWCVDFRDDGQFFAHLAEDYGTWQAMVGHRVITFQAAGQNCVALRETAGFIFQGPNPFPAPPVEPTCDPEVIVQVVEVEKIVRVEVPVPGPERIVEVTSTQTVTDPAQARTIAKQARRIDRLQAKIRRLQGR